MPTPARRKQLQAAPVAGGENLSPGPAAVVETDAPPRQAPPASVAAALTTEAPRAVFVHLASSERRAEEIARALAAFDPVAETILLPPWDCLPYDRASPSRDVMARRMAALNALRRKPTGRRYLVISPEAVAQRLPPLAALEGAFLDIAPGDKLERTALARFAASTGYIADDRIDEPGEIALLGGVIDLFPADAERPVRIVHGEDGAVGEIRTYDPLTQRTVGALDALRIGPASELVLPLDEVSADALAEPREPGLEHRLGAHYPELVTLFEVLPKADLSRDDRAQERMERFADQVEEAYAARRSFDSEPVSPPSSLYLNAPELSEALDGWRALALPLADIAPVPIFARSRNPGGTFCAFLQQQMALGRRVVLCGRPHELKALNRAVRRGLDRTPEPADSWAAILAAPAGAMLSRDADIDAGFDDPSAAVTVIAAADVLGGRVAERKSGQGDLQLAEPELRIGDVLIHEDHGVGVLRDLEVIDIDGRERDALRLEYHGDASLLAPVDEIGKIWRYGGEEAAVTLDRLKGEGWAKRKAEVSRHIETAAEHLVAEVRQREAATCPPMVPPKAPYAKFAAGFAYPETPDQAGAIAAVLDDLASGRPMDRLVCGDVGFGKTEVALRAAAAVALCGRQVAVVAPTTVLARQHVQTFERRFSRTGLRIAQLSRLVSAAEAKAVRQGLAAGEIDIVIGTHAIASDTAFADLGLMIIDEEQKFGAAVKQQLRALATEGHLLTLTATPIPRTLQAAMVGLQEVSVIASPPARRRPIRTFLAPYDPATLRTALLREKRRGGQSFVVVPRIDDIEPLADRLRGLAPELSVTVAHGGLAADVVDAAMVRFADGDGDILLATNIIESGLDVPRANTMIVWRPEQFGLAQLHQLRGRVGRGRAQGVAYLLTEDMDGLGDATRSRLSTLEAFDRLGSGLAISARDLDLRGGGDLVGDDQAGHMQMIGAQLYQRSLERALRRARGEAVEDEWTPSVNVGEPGVIPADYVPDATVRINLYARLARLETAEDVDGFEEELADRFGPPPPAVGALLWRSRLQQLARAAGVRAISAGPKGVALTVRPRTAEAMLPRLEKGEWPVHAKDDRLIIALREDQDQAAITEAALTRLQ